jgi:hypothetical protein
VDHCCSPVFIGVPVAQSVDVCGVLWTIVVHPVFIGVPIAQSVDVCSVLWTIVVHSVFIGVPVAQFLHLCVVFCGPVLFTSYLLGLLFLNL